MFVRLLCALAALLLAPPVAARETGFLDRQLTVAGERYDYQVYVPRGVRTTRGMPIVLALHGAGERGSDGLLQTQVGLGGGIRQHVDRWPAIVVMPQVRAGRLWQNSEAVALGALAAAEREFGTDRNRVYLTGMSMGGNGTWKLAYANPGRFAAIVVICGFVEPINISQRNYQPIVHATAGDPFSAMAAKLGRLPVWIVHGDADSVVPVTDSRRMAAALKAAGGRVTYKELPGVNHNAWDPAFADPALPTWLFAQRRGQ